MYFSQIIRQKIASTGMYICRCVIAVELASCRPPLVPDAARQYQPAVLPPKEHPQLWVTPESLEKVKATLTHPEHAAQWESVRRPAAAGKACSRGRVRAGRRIAGTIVSPRRGQCASCALSAGAIPSTTGNRWCLQGPPVGDTCLRRMQLSRGWEGVSRRVWSTSPGR